MTAPVTLRAPRRFFGLLFAILAVAAAVRWSVIDRDALWLDEGYSWWDALQPIRALWTLVPNCDPHPPLYFALLHGWLKLVGDSTVAMRLLSLLFGLGAIATIYLAGRQLDFARGAGDRRFGIGFLAALLFALTPFQVYFSVEARPYALLCFGSALLVHGCLRTVRSSLIEDRHRGFRWRDRVSGRGWASLLVGGAIVVWTNNTAVLVLGAASTAFIMLWIFDPDSRSTMVPVVAAGLLIGVIWAPDWPLLITQSREVTGDFWIPPPTFEGLTFELHNLIGLDVLRWTWWIVLVIACGVATIGRRIGWRWALMVGALAGLPIAYNVAISYLVSPILLSRAMMTAAPACVIALAAAAMLVRPVALRVVFACALVLIHGISLSRYLAADHVKEPWKPVIAQLAIDARQVPVLVIPNELALPLAHEAALERVKLRVRGVPADYPATNMNARYPSGKCAPSVIDQNLGAVVDSLRNERVIVLLTRLNNTYDPHEDMKAALERGGYRVAKETVYEPGDLRIMRFVREGM